MKVYATRDRDGTLSLFKEKPKKGEREWLVWRICFIILDEGDLPEGVNPQWEDEEPIEVELKIEKI